MIGERQGNNLEKKAPATGCSFFVGIVINIALIVIFYFTVEDIPDMGFDEIVDNINVIIEQVKEEYEVLKNDELLAPRPEIEEQ